MVKISILILTVALFTTSAFSVAIPPDARHHNHHNGNSVIPLNAEDSQPQKLAARDPNLFSLGEKLVKEGIHVAKSRGARKLVQGVAKGGHGHGHGHGRGKKLVRGGVRVAKSPTSRKLMRGAAEVAYENLAERDPNWLSFGKKIVKEGVHVAESRKGRKVLKGAVVVAGFL
ncbi:hypothetical protein BJ912DRAFT_1066315 [Pholiota molesta]|nr:hypothetical protein BJ912DRAFT_1066315 [Pholiota molesta]